MDTIQTTQFVNGQWVTRNVNLREVLEQNRRPPSESMMDPPTPTVGLLTQPIIDDPVAHWILPIRLQRDGDQDIVFIGDTSLRISRLLNDGRMMQLVKESDFGSRIRSALLLDFVEAATPPNETRTMYGDTVMTESTDEPPAPAWNRKSKPKEVWKAPREWHSHKFYPSKLPPQCIVLALESGVILFVVPRQEGPDATIAVSRQDASKPLLVEQPGKHLAVDPRTRYLAAGCSENHFTVFDLEPDSILRKQAGQRSRPVKAIQHFNIEGTILKMEFLHPAKDLSQLTILLLLVVQKGQTRMHLYEWETTDDLWQIQSSIQQGYQLPLQFRMPLLLIPLSFRSSFILVCADVIVVCEGLVQGYPVYKELPLSAEPPTLHHTGLGPPLWTAYAKPMRFGPYSDHHDDLYLAREDGVVKFIEVDDSEDFMQAEMLAGAFACNIGTAFASLGRADTSNNDLLIAGNESGAGAIYEIFPGPKSEPQLITTIPSCSHMLDLSRYSETESQDLYGRPVRSIEDLMNRQPDRLYACTARNSARSVVELRCGYELKLNFEVDFIPRPVGCWELSSTYSSIPHMLISLGNQSTLLLPAVDNTNIMSVPQFGTWLDISHRTILALSCAGRTVQITERNIHVSKDSIRLPAASAKVVQLSDDSIQTILAASVYGDYILIAYSDINSLNFLGLVKICGRPDLTESLELIKVYALKNRVPTSVLISPLVGELSLCIVGFSNFSNSESQRDSNFEREGLQSLLTVFTLDLGSGMLDPVSIQFVNGDDLKDESRHVHQTLFQPSGPQPELRDAVTGIAILRHGLDEISEIRMMLIGFRSGMLCAARIEQTQQELLGRVQFYESIGLTAVTFAFDEDNPSIVTILCNGKIYKEAFHPKQPFSWALRPLWLTEIGNETLCQPVVEYMCAFFGHLLLITSGKILAASLEDGVRILPRLIQPQTTGPQLCLDGLADVTLRYTMLTSTSSGRLRCLKYWHFLEVDNPDSTLFVVMGFQSGLLQVHRSNDLYAELDMGAQIGAIDTYGHSIFCGAGSTIVWLMLETSGSAVESFFTMMAEYDLPSPAVSISFTAKDNLSPSSISGFIHVVTSEHSLLSFFVSGTDTKAARIWPVAADEVARNGLSHVSVIPSQSLTAELPLVVVSDRTCSVTGLYHRSFDPTHPSRGGPDCLTLFEAEMPSSMLKLQFTETRPPWDAFWKRNNSTSPPADFGIPGTLPWTNTRSDLLGIGLNGSMFSFTLLNEDLWRLLSFIQSKARRSEAICPITYDMRRPSLPDANPRAKHIDGNVLQKSLGHLHEILEQSAELDALVERIIPEAVQHVTAVEKLLEQLLRPVL